jgi:Carboxypeptidase regulatory-like domain
MFSLLRFSHAAEAFLLISLAGQARAQVLYGSIVGSVTDESNTGVPGAKVTITQNETSEARELLTTDTGGYTFTNVLAGTYSVVVSKQGFQSFTARNIVVQLNSVVRVDASIKVGAVSESVEVTAEAATLQTDRADVHAETTTQQLENLPVTGRSFQSLLFDTPGVTQPIYFQTGGINNPSRSMEFDVNGTRPDSDEMCLQCHQSLREQPEHHTHHALGTEASRCVSCHMPRIMDALLFRARSHQIDDLPDPGMTQRFGDNDSPNACLICHRDRDWGWLRNQSARLWPAH